MDFINNNKLILAHQLWNIYHIYVMLTVRETVCNVYRKCLIAKEVFYKFKTTLKYILLYIRTIYTM